jgi:hypothetical protein
VADQILETGQGEMIRRPALLLIFISLAVFCFSASHADEKPAVSLGGSALLPDSESLGDEPTKSLSALNLTTLTKAERAQVLELGQLSIERQIEAISKVVPLELLKSNRKGGTHAFDKLGPAVENVEDVTDVEGLYGKSMCPKNGEPAKILIADDAPPATLIHEYIHFLQMKHEKRWCELDGRILEGDEKRERALLYHKFEFETLKTMWDMRPKLLLTFEDKLILVEGLSREDRVLRAMGVRALDDETAKRLQDELDEVHAQINYLTWLTQTREDAATVMQKMEVITLKSCAEQDGKKPKSGDDIKRLNACLEKRCAISKIKCSKLEPKDIDAKEDLWSKAIYIWFKPDIPADCGITKLKNELTDDIEKSTSCWKKWHVKHFKPEKNLQLDGVPDKTMAKRFDVPVLPIDKQIKYYEVSNPESFIHNAYCYFIFQKVARFDTLPIDQFAYAAQGASMSAAKVGEYRSWLDKSSEGQICSKLVNVFTGTEPSRYENLFGDKSFILIVNPIASLTGGLGELKPTMKVNVNHERLHVIFSEDKSVQEKTRKEWQSLSAEDQEAFKKQHGSYDFGDEMTLLREYFSYTRQDNPKKLF